jgi:hypothetical protein
MSRFAGAILNSPYERKSRSFSELCHVNVQLESSSLAERTQFSFAISEA